MLKSAFVFIALCCVATTVVTTVPTTVAAAATYHVDDDSTATAPDGSGWDNTHCFKYLQDALDIAVPGDTIKVAGGKYRPDQDSTNTHTPNDRTESFILENDVKLDGGYSGLADPGNPDVRGVYISILTGDIDTANDASDNSYHVVTGGDATNLTRLNRFTITLGNGDGNPSLNQNKGAGIYLPEFASPRIENCTVEYCTVDPENGFGGGLYCSGTSVPTVTGSTFRNNVAGFGAGTAIEGGGEPVIISGCLFSFNTAHTGAGLFTQRKTVVRQSDFALNTAPAVVGMFNGGAAVAAWADIEIRESNIGHNTAIDSTGASIVGGGLYVNDGIATVIRTNFIENKIITTGSSGILSAFGAGASLHPGGTIVNCEFRGNSIADSAGGDRGAGGGLVVSKGARVENSLLFDNRAEQAGAIWIFDPIVTITNCTITRNTASGAYSTGGIWFSPFLEFAPGTTITNSIVWMNAGGALTTEEKQIRDVAGGLGLDVSYNDIEGRIVGGQFDSGVDVNNLDADPLFVDEPNANFRLRRCSICVDAGSTPSAPVDTLGVIGPATAACSDCGGNRTWDLDLHYRVTDMPRTDSGQIETMCRNCGLTVDLGVYERYPLGDLNFDGIVNGLDIQPFVDCIKGHFGSPPSEQCINADMNEDGILSFDDVTCFINILLGLPSCVQTCGVGGGEGAGGGEGGQGQTTPGGGQGGSDAPSNGPNQDSNGNQSAGDGETNGSNGGGEGGSDGAGSSDADSTWDPMNDPEDPGFPQRYAAYQAWLSEHPRDAYPSLSDDDYDLWTGTVALDMMYTLPTP